MIGSEGTLGFVSQATYNTVPEWPHKASAFILFPDVMSACQAASGACRRGEAEWGWAAAGCMASSEHGSVSIAVAASPTSPTLPLLPPHTPHTLLLLLQCCATRPAWTRWRCLTAPRCASARATRT